MEIPPNEESKNGRIGMFLENYSQNNKEKKHSWEQSKGDNGIDVASVHRHMHRNTNERNITTLLGKAHTAWRRVHLNMMLNMVSQVL